MAEPSWSGRDSSWSAAPQGASTEAALTEVATREVAARGLESEELFPAGTLGDAGALGVAVPEEAPEGGVPERYEAGEALTTGSVFRLTAATFLESKLAIAGLGILVFLVLFCFVGPHIYVTNQRTVNPVDSNFAPSGAHLLGTDPEGFDVLGRLMVAGQSSIEIGIAAGLAAAIFGTLYGAVSAVAGGIVDAVLMRVVDALYSLPGLFLLILLAAIFKPDLPLMIGVLTFVAWLGPARLVRGEALSLRTREYVQAVKVAGGTQARIVVRHIVPNTIGTIMVNTSFLIADAILALAALSFLGLGLPDTTPTWGGMLNTGVTYIFDGYWWEIYPAGIAIVLTVVAFNLMGDALRDSLDVRLQRR
jgi:peptide/nickel transport system permease protein